MAADLTTGSDTEPGDEPGGLETAFGAEIASYVPAGNPPGWSRVADEVRAAVTQAAPLTSYPPGELMGVLAKLALFADAEGHPLQAAMWLSREYIERFVHVGCAHLGVRTRATYRSKLLRLREALLGGDCRTGAPVKLPGSVASSPYSPAEQSALWSWAAGQPTEELRHGLIVLLALGLGCGLDSSEIIPLRTSDVRVTGQGTGQAASSMVVVAVRGRRARMIVCRRSWERVLAGQAARLAKRTGDQAAEAGTYLFRPATSTRGGNIVTNFLARAHTAPGTPALKTTRLRSTWLVGLIEEGVPLQVIVSAAGLETLHSLTRVLPFVGGIDPADAARLLRGNP